jgi:hypothetical protein
MKKRNENTEITDKEIVNAIRQVGKDKEAVEALKSLSESDLKDLLQKERNKKQGGKSVRLLIYSISSVAAILALVFLVNFYNKPARLYQAYFELPTNQYFELASRGVSEIAQLPPELKHLINRFFRLYDKKRQGQYRKEALSLLMSQFNDEELKQFPELLFYVSICRMELDKTAEAEKNLVFLSGLGDSYPYYQDVDWYLSLVYLKEGQKSKAKDLLEKIKDNDGFYAGKASNLLTEL